MITAVSRRGTWSGTDYHCIDSERFNILVKLGMSLSDVPCFEAGSHFRHRMTTRHDLSLGHHRFGLPRAQNPSVPPPDRKLRAAMLESSPVRGHNRTGSGVRKRGNPRVSNA
jgi:hypothetical protein